MKYSEFHRVIRRNGWILARTRGSHYMYSKNGVTYCVPYHSSKEMNEGLRRTIIKEMKLTNR
ncbi:type II toxin-antitoxin system HicA family toxin [Dyadobacter sp. BHUBP1]|uniref:type II toxin-antitoxin system HicA family toxin n=1 Tax=Dyadobacter sp. BHUBP1 TaxID=3424178 RepID=UPI003D34C933